MSSFAPNWQYGTTKRYGEETEIDYETHFYKEVDAETDLDFQPYDIDFDRFSSKWSRRTKKQQMRHKEDWQ
jgi:hypothetical protein